MDYILTIFDQKACPITNDLDQFWTSFDPYLIMLSFEIIYFLDILDHKARAISHVF